MESLRYLRWDVFTDQPFTGNQPAVLLDGDGVAQARDLLNVQGVHMGRRSAIRIAIGSADGAITTVAVGGTAVPIGHGVIAL